MTLSQKEQQYELLLKSFDKLANVNNISYYITGGGLLGIYRYNQLLYWDADLDIAIVEPKKFWDFTEKYNDRFIYYE